MALPLQDIYAVLWYEIQLLVYIGFT